MLSSCSQRQEEPLSANSETLSLIEARLRSGEVSPLLSPFRQWANDLVRQTTSAKQGTALSDKEIAEAREALGQFRRGEFWKVLHTQKRISAELRTMQEMLHRHLAEYDPSAVTSVYVGYVQAHPLTSATEQEMFLKTLAIYQQFLPARNPQLRSQFSDCRGCQQQGLVVGISLGKDRPWFEWMTTNCKAMFDDGTCIGN